MKIISMAVTQTRVFGPDALPIVTLALNEQFDELTARYSFADAQRKTIPPGHLQLAWNLGSFRVDDDRVVAVTNMVIEPRRILLEAQANSKEAEDVFSDLREFLLGLYGTTHTDLEPWITTERTTCTCHLDLGSRFVGEELSAFVEEEAPTLLALEGSSASAELLGIAYRVRFDTDPNLRRKYGLSLGDEELKIEHRLDTPGAPTYVVTAPVESERLCDLLRGLENACGSGTSESDASER